VKVKLLSYTPEPLKTLYLAARTCYSSKCPDEIHTDDKEKMEKLIQEIVKRGHLSILEHISFTFSISGVSRVLTHQLVRHRLASYSQQSQRYVKISPNVIIPPKIKKNQETKQLFEEEIERIFKI